MYDATTYQVVRQWGGDLSWQQNACLMDAISKSGRIVDLGGVSVLRTAPRSSGNRDTFHPIPG